MRSLKIEIALAFGVVIALMFALGVAFYLSEQRSAIALDKLLKSDSRMADLSLRTSQAMLRAHVAESDFLLSVDRLGVAEARERYVLPMQNHLLDMREYLTSFRILSSDPSLRDTIGRIEQQTQRYEDGFLAFVDLYGKPGQVDTANATRQDYVAAALTIDPLLEDLHTTATKRAIQTRGGVESAANITRWTVFIAVAIATLLGTAVAMIVWWRITGSGTQLVTFSRHVAAGNFSARAPQSRENEFAILAYAMNQMAESLENSQAQLLATARQAGMAEIASNVLHNVGNVLNSVNVSASLVNSKMRDSKARGLVKAVELMDAQGPDLGHFLTQDDKGKVLPAYLRKVVAALVVEQQSVVGELDSLTKSIDHIKEIVAMQQSYAGGTSVVEPVRVSDLLEEALRMNAAALARHRVVVVREFAGLPVLLLDKPRLLQILVNLIGNAGQAMNGVLERPARITLRADITGSGAESRLRIQVEDAGEGIAPENLERIFAHGFTTRENGHGFGLHSCILAAQAMGGALTAHSDGLGLGATFTLTLPVQPEEEIHDYI